MWTVFMFVFFFKQKTAYEMRISDWSSDVCSSDLRALPEERARSLAKEGRRRLPAGTALALRPAQPRRGPRRSRPVARPMERQISQAHRLGRGDDRGDLLLLPAATQASQAHEKHQHARTLQ